MEPPERLWVTKVGSHLWGMEHEGSDTDLYSAYRVHTCDLLAGRIGDNGTHFSCDPVAGIDEQRHEVGVWVRQLMKGNVNYVWAVLSPKIVVDSPWLRRLDQIVKATASKAVVAPIKGMAYSAVRDLGLPTHAGKELKKYGQAIRALRFGIAWCNGQGPRFADVVPESCCHEEFQRSMIEIDEACNESELPDRPEPEPFHRFLLDIRMDDLDQELFANPELKPAGAAP